MTVLSPLLLALLTVALVGLAGAVRPRWGAPVGAVLSGLTCAAVLGGWLAGGGDVAIDWAPTWGLRLSFTLDGLAALYAALAAGVGAVVFAYSAGYMPRHLEHGHRPQSEQARFHTLLALFLAAMIGLALADDLILLFVFWDLTAVTSYFLIGFDRHRAGPRTAALTALVVTGVTAVLFLIGAVVLHARYETASVAELLRRAEPGRPLTAASALIAVAALAKSAQVPFHFWLPRAMTAPTPVSAYLHSAAMVAAGVFLLQRVLPLVHRSDPLPDVLLGVGLASMAVGGMLALVARELKELLAYSTVAQYGYVVVLLGVGGEYGAAGASFYVLAHALIKSSLFLTAGAVTEATGENELARLGGLRRSMPVLAVASGVSAAGLAGLPLTVGFFKDELFFQAALDRGWPLAVAAVAGAALTLAYVWRFWRGIFLGASRRRVRPIPVTLVAPVVVLAGLVLVGGVFAGPFASLAAAAGAATLGAPVSVEAEYHLDARPTNLMVLAVYAAGVALVVSRPAWGRVAGPLRHLTARVGPDGWYFLALAGLRRAGDKARRFEARSLADRVAAVLVPTALLVGAGVVVSPSGAYQVGTVTPEDVPLALALLLVALAAVLTTFPKRHLDLVLTLGGFGGASALTFAFFGAPDVALVAAVIGILTTLLFAAVLALFPREALRDEATTPGRPARLWWGRLVGLATAAAAFVTAWSILSRPAARQSMARDHLRLTPEAHAQDVVTAILADFRGLDTMGEVTVIAVALLGAVTLLGRRRRARS